MRKFLIFILAMVLVFALLVPVSARAVEFVFWTTESEAEGLLQTIEELCREFEKENPGVRIETLNYDVESLRENFQMAAFAGGGPDLLWTVNDHAGPFATMGIISSVEEMFGAGYTDKFVQPGLEAVEMDGKTWGIPISVGNHLMLMYNKKLLPEPPKDTDEMIAIAKELTTGDQYGLVFNLNEPFWLAPWLGGFGGWPLDGNTPTLNTEAMVNALQFIHDLKFKHQIVPREADAETADSLFKEGKAAMIITGDWALSSYITPEVKRNVELGVARIPMISETGLWPSPMTSGKYFMIPNYLTGDRLEYCKKLVDYFVSPKLQNLFVKEHARLPALIEAFDEPALAEDPILLGSADQMVVGKPMPTVPEMRACWDAMFPNIEGVMSDRMTPQEAAEAMQVAAERAIREMDR